MLLDEQVTCYSTKYIHTYTHTQMYVHTHTAYVCTHISTYICTYSIAGKFDGELNLLGLEVGVEIAKLKSINICARNA